MAPLILGTTAPSKDALPWLKCARFGQVKTDEGSLRHNANVLAISGLEADYDAGIMSVDAAVDILRNAGTSAMVYTSPSHTEAAPRWRVLCQFSTEYSPERRDEFMGRLNGLYGGILCGSSWTLSQSFYLGSVDSNQAHRVELIEGTPIDQHAELDSTWLGKPSASGATAKAGRQSATTTTAAALGSGGPAGVFAGRSGPDMAGAAKARSPTGFEGLPSDKQNQMLAAMLAWPAILAMADVDKDAGWLNVLFALAHAERLGATDARALAEAWCRTCPTRFDEKSFNTDWASFKLKPSGTTIATLISLARDAGFDSVSWLHSPTLDQASAPDEGADTVYRAFLGRAAELRHSASPVSHAEELATEIVRSHVPDAFLKPLAAAIGKATGSEFDEWLKLMRFGRKSKVAATPQVTLPGMQNPEPATHPTPLAECLAAAEKVLRRQVVMPDHLVVATVLWAVATFGFRGAKIFPRLIITSATKRCGKSTLLEILKMLVSTPVKADNISASALFRLIPVVSPTMLLDEVDSAARDDIVNILNAGYDASGVVIRSEATPDGKSWQAVVFPIFCPVVVCGIGSVADTVRDRSIEIRLERAESRGVSARRRPMRGRELEQAHALIVPHLVAHAPSIQAALEQGVASFPQALDDRAQDAWEPLLAVADLAGGSWPQRAHAAALALSGGRDTASLREVLLGDLREIVNQSRLAAVTAWRGWRAAGRQGTRPVRALHLVTERTLRELLLLEHRPWAEHGPDHRGISPTRLASMLRPFKIEPSAQRVLIWPPPRAAAVPTTVVLRGYAIPQLRALFRRYL